MSAEKPFHFKSLRRLPVLPQTLRTPSEAVTAGPSPTKRRARPARRTRLVETPVVAQKAIPTPVFRRPKVAGTEGRQESGDDGADGDALDPIVTPDFTGNGQVKISGNSGVNRGAGKGMGRLGEKRRVRRRISLGGEVVEEVDGVGVVGTEEICDEVDGNEAEVAVVVVGRAGGSSQDSDLVMETLNAGEETTVFGHEAVRAHEGDKASAEALGRGKLSSRGKKLCLDSEPSHKSYFANFETEEIADEEDVDEEGEKGDVEGDGAEEGNAGGGESGLRMEVLKVGDETPLLGQGINYGDGSGEIDVRIGAERGGISTSTKRGSGDGDVTEGGGTTRKRLSRVLMSESPFIRDSSVRGWLAVAESPVVGGGYSVSRGDGSSGRLPPLPRTSRLASPAAGDSVLRCGRQMSIRKRGRQLSDEQFGAALSVQRAVADESSVAKKVNFEDSVRKGPAACELVADGSESRLSSGKRKHRPPLATPATVQKRSRGFLSCRRTSCGAETTGSAAGVGLVPTESVPKRDGRSSRPTAPAVVNSAVCASPLVNREVLRGKDGASACANDSAVRRKGRGTLTESPVVRGGIMDAILDPELSEGIFTAQEELSFQTLRTADATCVTSAAAARRNGSGTGGRAGDVDIGALCAQDLDPSQKMQLIQMPVVRRDIGGGSLALNEQIDATQRTTTAALGDCDRQVSSPMRKNQLASVTSVPRRAVASGVDELFTTGSTSRQRRPAALAESPVVIDNVSGAGLDGDLSEGIFTGQEELSFQTLRTADATSEVHVAGADGVEEDPFAERGDSDRKSDPQDCADEKCGTEFLQESQRLDGEIEEADDEEANDSATSGAKPAPAESRENESGQGPSSALKSCAISLSNPNTRIRLRNCNLFPSHQASYKSESDATAPACVIGSGTPWPFLAATVPPSGPSHGDVRLVLDMNRPANYTESYASASESSSGKARGKAGVLLPGSSGQRGFGKQDTPSMGSRQNEKFTRLSFAAIPEGQGDQVTVSTPLSKPENSFLDSPSAYASSPSPSSMSRRARSKDSTPQRSAQVRSFHSPIPNDSDHISEQSVGSAASTAPPPESLSDFVKCMRSIRPTEKSDSIDTIEDGEDEELTRTATMRKLMRVPHAIPKLRGLLSDEEEESGGELEDKVEIVKLRSRKKSRSDAGSERDCCIEKDQRVESGSGTRKLGESQKLGDITLSDEDDDDDDDDDDDE